MMAKVVLAVSGGIDSMVMLDMIYRFFDYSPHDIIIAHFDHGTRPSSADDADFVQRKAEEYGVQLRTERAELGTGVAEEVARKARYEFFARVQAEADGATLFTAHHLCDLVESVAINCVRGTGWRGLAVLGRKGARRPFLDRESAPAALRELIPLDKTAIRRYAANYDISFREDPSNSSDEYLRNRIRHEMNNSPRFGRAEMLEIYELWRKQWRLRTEIESLLTEIMAENPEKQWPREWWRKLDEKCGLELLKAVVERGGIGATRPQLERFRQAILDYAPGKYFNLGEDKLVKIGKTGFEI